MPNWRYFFEILAKLGLGPTERVVFRELDTVTLEGIFQHITNAAIFIEWRPAKSL
jgi:hypothetical protein